MELLRYEGSYYINKYALASSEGINLKEVDALIENSEIALVKGSVAKGYDSITHTLNMNNIHMENNLAVIPLTEDYTRMQSAHGILYTGADVDVNNPFGKVRSFLLAYSGLHWVQNGTTLSVTNPETLKSRLEGTVEDLIEAHRAILIRSRGLTETSLYCAYGEQSLRYKSNPCKETIAPFVIEAELKGIDPEELATKTAKLYEDWISNNRILQGLSSMVRAKFKKQDARDQKGTIELALSLRQSIRDIYEKHGV